MTTKQNQLVRRLEELGFWHEAAILRATGRLTEHAAWVLRTWGADR